MMRKIFAFSMALVLCACNAQETLTLPPATFRELTAAEKNSLQGALAQTLKDTSAAQFAWGPVIVVGNTKAQVGYCASVNGKNSYGGYVGFRRFFAMLTPNSSGQYLTGKIDVISGPPLTFGGSGSASEAFDTGQVEGFCKGWGYPPPV